MNSNMDFIVKNLFHLLLSIPNTLVFNFKVLPIKHAIKCPFIVSYRVRFKGVNRNTFVVLNQNMRTASCRIGFGSTVGNRRESKKGEIVILGNGRIVCNGKIGLSEGCILIASDATLTLGDNFRCNYSTTIDCAGSDIVFGKDVVCGWNVTFKNSDGHYIVNRGGTFSLWRNYNRESCLDLFARHCSEKLLCW